MCAGLLGTCISTTSTVFSLFTGSKEPRGGVGSRELKNVFILAIKARFSQIATALFSCTEYSIS